MTQRLFLMLALLLVVAASGATAAPAGTVTRHDLSASIEPATHGIAVTDTMTVTGSELSFVLSSSLAIHKIEVDGAAVSAKVGSPRAGVSSYVVPLGGPGEHVVEVRYRGTIHDPVKKATDLAFVVGDHTSGTISNGGVFLSGSSLWYPAVEGSMPLFDIEVSVPDGWHAISQGELTGELTEELRNVSTWKAHQPSDQLYVQAGKFHLTRRVHGDVTLGVALLNPDPAVAKLFLDELAGYLDLYQPLLGPYPHPRFEVVENFFTSGYGMPGYTLLGGDVIQHIQMMTMRNRGKIPPGYLDHELMHGWWGNGVYLDYEKGNWCEGLTSYCTNYYRKEIESADAARAHRERVARRFSVMVHPETEYPVRAFRGKTEDYENDIGYGKASMIFHMVRREIGDEAFWKALRTVAKAFRGRQADWADFETAFEKASSEDLGAFFEHWLGRKGGPRLAVENVEVAAWCGKPSHARGEIVQRGEPWPIDVEVVARAGDRVLGRTVVHCEGERTPFDVAYMGPGAVEVALDPEFHLFRLYPAAAIPACLNATVEDPEKMVVPAPDVDAYAQAAARATAKKGGEVKAPEDVAAGDLAGRSLLLLGAPWENRIVAKLLSEAGDSVVVERESIRIGGEVWKGKALSLLLSFRHPRSPERFVTIYLDLDRGAIRRPPRFFFYGWDGFVVYDGGRPVSRGTLVEAADPAIHRVRGPVPEVPPDDHTPPDDPAAEPSGEEARALLEALCALDGRGTNQPGGARAEELVAREMYRAGLTVRRQPFAFRVTDFRGGWIAVGEGPDAKVVRDAFRPLPWSKEGDFTLRFADLEKHLVPWPAEDDWPAWQPFTYPSRLSVPARLVLDKCAKTGRPTDPWHLVSGIQARLAGVEREIPDVPLVAIRPRVLEGLRRDDQVRVMVRFDRHQVTSANVVGRLAGTDPHAPTIVVGAHYDGLGIHGETTFACADDNASGIAAMLVAARRIAAGPRLTRPVEFVAFGAEEWGLRGSTAFVESLGERKIEAMVNLDTIGRRGVDDVYVIGRSKHPALAMAAVESLEAAGFGIGRDIDRFAFAHGSDHWPFHEAGIPAIDLWSSDYKVMNSTKDTLEDVDPIKVEKIAAALESLVRRLAGD